uniref:Uncharacterized protein n=1 Tax=Stylophora pistillata TaxID=50429 RepID=A0A2B4R110_STYPI
MVCYLQEDANEDDNRPSLQSFLQASSTNEDQDLRLSGLAVLSKLANACQPLVDVNKAKMQINKIALVSVEDMTVCSGRNLVLNAQNAGYSVVIYFPKDNYGLLGNVTKPETQEEILIPFGSVWGCDNNTNSLKRPTTNLDGILEAVGKTGVNKCVITVEDSENLKHMANYLRRLYYWFLLGPVITLEWLRRKKKFCCVTGISQQVVEESTVGNAETEESQEQNIHDITGEGNEDESQPLIIIMDANAASTRNDNVGRCRIVVSMTRIFGKVSLSVKVLGPFRQTSQS